MQKYSIRIKFDNDMEDIFLQYSLQELKTRNKELLNEYLKKEKKMMDLIYSLFVLNDFEMDIILKPLSKFDKNKYMYSERNYFFSMIKKLKFEEAFLSRKKSVNTKKEFVFFIKFGIRESDRIKGNVQIFFDKLQIKLVSNGEYGYDCCVGGELDVIDIIK